ncbi:hypothetical protein [Halostagnicola kamekurae]|uniref:Uncharacterized protein n=1 Tax=Halostagnicola kamekurae TaxID=619731 RepID=A0A1I6SET6_9EURY|nr:hypothetical protein [Halostagnicola kamekurae]SFS75472.1 hypothetical protein SAMN04488556_2618 [Halostagnicola kamekurae]
MSDRTARLEYTRSTLEEAPASETSQYETADLDAVARSIEDRLESRLETDRLDSGAAADAGPEGIRSERSRSDGTRGDTDEGGNGTDGRISAVLGTDSIGFRSFEYKPRGPHGAMIIMIGLLAAFPTIFTSLLLSAFGYYLYRTEREGEIPLRRWETVDVLVADAAGDRDRESGSPNSSTVEATAAAESFVGVDTDRLVDLPWAHRKAIVMRVEQWATEATRDVAPRNDDDVFFEYLRMWINRSASADREKVDSLQTEIARDPAARRHFTDRLLEDSADIEADSSDHAELLTVLDVDE